MTRGRASIWSVATAAAVVVYAALALDAALMCSATYDEADYLRLAARWWRTGDQEAISRMGSPLSFWKIQQAPVLWAIDRAGFGALIDDPDAHQAALLPLVRAGGLWIGAVGLGLTATWARRMYGPRAMAFAACLFALSPNLIAHGALATMEMPLLAASAAQFLLFWLFLRTGRRRWFLASAAVGGLAFSCKFTAALFPALLGLAWAVEMSRDGRPARAIFVRVAAGMIGYVAIVAAGDLLVTAGATLPISTTKGDHPRLSGPFGSLLSRLVEVPVPSDLVGFLRQMHHQSTGGPSYLLGERRATGWWHYYFVAMAVKVPLSFWLLVAGRAVAGRRVPSAGRGSILLIVPLGFLAITAIGSTRNYGFRYLLPLAPIAIVWVSGLAESPARWAKVVTVAGLLGQAGAIATTHPHELTFFNTLGGGAVGGRHLLADSNLDWGQGARALARLQRARPEFRDITVYAFGNADPAAYGVVGTCYVIDAGTVHPGLPPRLAARTGYLAVSASLRHGPWGPEGYFRALEGVEPVARTDDGTFEVYRVGVIGRIPGAEGRSTGRQLRPARRAELGARRHRLAALGAELGGPGRGRGGGGRSG